MESHQFLRIRALRISFKRGQTMKPVLHSQAQLAMKRDAIAILKRGDGTTVCVSDHSISKTQFEELLGLQDEYVVLHSIIPAGGPSYCGGGWTYWVMPNGSMARYGSDHDEGWTSANFARTDSDSYPLIKSGLKLQAENRHFEWHPQQE